MRKVNSSLIIFSFLNFFGCENKNEKLINQNQNLLTQVAHKSIMVNDFIKRCEYVPRPAYCRGDNYIHKKIALNSLIAEKLLALEFEKNNLKLNDTHQSLIIGQQEQVMRQLMLKTFGYDSVKIDNKIIRDLLELDKRTYEIKFIIIENNLDDQIKKFSQEKSLISLIQKIDFGGYVQYKKVSKNETMLDDIKKILFEEKPSKEKVYGPFKINKDQNLYFEIDTWVNSVDITEKEKIERWETIQKEYKEAEALKHYSKYVKRLMKGKKIDYNSDVFQFFSNKLRKIYLIEKEKKEAVINKKIWEIDESVEVTSFDDIKKMDNRIIFSHDGREYKIKDLLDLIKKHPLVFRNKKTNKDLFSNELKYAIADLIRDHHITNKAYELNYDEKINILNIKNKWEDHIKSNVYKTEFYDSKSFKSLSKKVDSLQIIYSDMIKIDTDKFEKIKLSSIDMNVNYSNQAYSKIEPGFPILTDDHLLDYGEKVTFND
jgi:hypothetical protein